MGCISGTYSNAHIVLSRELASSNPELTLPLFSGKIAVSLEGRAVHSVLVVLLNGWGYVI